MNTVYEFKCESCECNWTIGMNDDHRSEWITTLVCPVCGDAGPEFNVLDYDLKKTEITDDRYNNRGYSGPRRSAMMTPKFTGRKVDLIVVDDVNAE